MPSYFDHLNPSYFDHNESANTYVMTLYHLTAPFARALQHSVAIRHHMPSTRARWTFEKSTRNPRGLTIVRWIHIGRECELTSCFDRSELIRTELKMKHDERLFYMHFQCALFPLLFVLTWINRNQCDRVSFIYGMDQLEYYTNTRIQVDD